MEPSFDTKAQILIFAINFATRGKKQNKMNKHKHSIPLECNSDNPPNNDSQQEKTDNPKIQKK